MGTITLREAEKADAALLGAVHVASWHETYGGIVPDEMLAAQSAPARTAMWGNILSAPKDYGCIAVFLAEDENRVVGFGSCGQQRDQTLADAGFSGEISAIYVLRSHQSQGAGRSIMAVMLQTLAAAGHTAVSLWVLRENHFARMFYDMLGGVIVGERVDERPGRALVEVAYGWRNLSSSVS